jgi:hypothetical protein
MTEAQVSAKARGLAGGALDGALDDPDRPVRSLLAAWLG